MVNGAITYKCGSCCKAVKDDCDAIQCELGCEYWYHIQCVGLDKKEYDRLSKSDEEWSCDKCSLIKSNNMLRNEVQNLNEVILALQADLQELQNRYDAERRNNTKLSEMCVLKEEEIVKLNYQMADTAKMTTRPEHRLSTSRCNVSLNRSLPVNTMGMKNFPPLPTRNRFDCLSADFDGVDIDAVDCILESTPRHRNHLKSSSLEKNKRVPLVSSSVTAVDGNRLNFRPTSTSAHFTNRPRAYRNHQIINRNFNRAGAIGTGSGKIKVHHYADSQGRGMSKELMSGCDFDIISVVKPGAKFHSVMPETNGGLGKDDFLVIQAGSNDVCRNESSDVLTALRRRIGTFYGTNVIVISIPHRYDLADWSCVNVAIQKTNEDIQKVCNFYSNCSFIDISRIGERFHTGHGLHLNQLGKHYVSDRIIACISDHISSLKLLSPIPLGVSFLE